MSQLFAVLLILSELIIFVLFASRCTLVHNVFDSCVPITDSRSPAPLPKLYFHSN